MHNKIELVSIITATYNRKNLLEKAIKSVINQKTDIPYNWEYIIIDDWSTDGTKKFIQKYLNQYPDNIKYFYQENWWVWKARNIWLDNINVNSDYTIILDDDDELKCDLFYFCLNKFNEYKKDWSINNIIWIYILCEDENWNIIWNKKILNKKNEVKFYYKNFLNWEINIEMWLITKSILFINKPKLRFPIDVITETVMRAKMWQYMNINWQFIELYDYVWRLYNINHTWERKITKSLTKDRFLKNAKWNEQVLNIIWNDLLKFWFIDNYWELLFRIWINYILSNNRDLWLEYLKKSIKFKKNLRNVWIYILSFISKRMTLLIYKLYNDYKN